MVFQRQVAFKIRLQRRQTRGAAQHSVRASRTTRNGYEVKATYSVNSSHRLQGNFIKVTELQVNDAFGSVMDLAESADPRAASGSVHHRLQRHPVAKHCSSRVDTLARRNSFIGSGAPTTDPSTEPCCRISARQPALLVADVLWRLRTRKSVTTTTHS